MAKTPHRACGAMAAHMMLLETNPSYRTNQMRLEAATERMRGTGLGKVSLVKVKTIVHVVFKQAAHNISDAQIKSQIAVLNRDFRAKNPDKSKVPPQFKGLIGDSQVQFELVKVTRTRTTKSSFGADDTVKKASTGGIAPIDPKKHLNIWVCPLSGGLLGYAQFPGGPVKTDGIVIQVTAFGTTGTATAPFHKGRTATHEIGHYFNLRHIWGDTPDCSGSDMVADTPNCAGPNFGKPVPPVITCNNAPNGDMYMNYMDYTDDDAMFMFSAGQVLRMRTTLSGPRAGLV